MKRFLLLLFVLSALGLSVAGAEWQPKVGNFEGLDSAIIRQLFEDGPFMVIKRRTKTNLPEVSSGIIIEASPQIVWKVVTDYEHRPEIIPGVIRVENVKVEGNKASFKQRNAIKFSFISFTWDEYRIHVQYPDKKRVIFFDANNPDFAAGGYEVVSLDGGKATLLLYSFTADLTQMGYPVGKMARAMPLIEEILMTSAAIMVVSGIKQYSEKRN